LYGEQARCDCPPKNPVNKRSEKIIRSMEFTEGYQNHDVRIAVQEQMIRERAQKDAIKQMEVERSRLQVENDMETTKSELVRTMNRAQAEAASIQGRKEATESTSDVDMAIVDARVKQQEEMVRARARKEANAAMDEERTRLQAEKDAEAARNELLRNFNKAAANNAAKEAMHEITSSAADLDLKTIDSKSAAQEELLRKQAKKAAVGAMEEERQRQLDVHSEADDAAKAERDHAIRVVSEAAGEEQQRRASLTPSKPME